MAAKQQPEVVYPVTDDMGEHEIQRLIAELLRPMLARWLADRRIVGHAGADQFIYYERGNPAKRVAPDVYVLPGVPQELLIPSWRVWETGIVPSFVLEIVGDDIRKDYDDCPTIYDAIGVQELAIFDPHAGSRSRHRIRWQMYRREHPDAPLARVEATPGDRVRSSVLDAWLRAVAEGDSVRVRLGVGSDGDELYPTEAEAERAAKEVERAGRLEAEAELARLRDLLATTRGPS